jgi:hypothetical protein
VPDVPAPRSAVDDDVVALVCREFVELVTEYLEHTLPVQLERAIAAHLELCEPCVIYLEQMGRTAAALRTLPVPTLPPAARERLLDVFTILHPAAADDS